MSTTKTYTVELTKTPELPLFPSLLTSPPNTICFKAHCHEKMEMLVVTEGEAFFEIMGETYKASAGDIAVINPYCTHLGYTKNSSAKYIILMFHLNDALGNMFSNELLQPIIERQSAFKPMIQDGYIYDTAVELLNTRDNKFFGFEISLLSKAYGILARLFEKHIDIKYDKPSINNKFREVIDFINHNYNKSISTADICNEYGYTESYFCRKFKEITGLAPMVYIKLLRLESAKNLLKETKTDINIISEACGFKDMGYFQKSFKSLYGKTPMQYRKHQK